MQDLSGWQGCERPHRKVFEGRFVRLEPLDIEKHGDGLFEAATEGDAGSRFRCLWKAFRKIGMSFKSG